MFALTAEAQSTRRMIFCLSGRCRQTKSSLLKDLNFSRRPEELLENRHLPILQKQDSPLRSLSLERVLASQDEWAVRNKRKKDTYGRIQCHREKGSPI
jgi:hypothetical protein